MYIFSIFTDTDTDVHSDILHSMFNAQCSAQCSETKRHIRAEARQQQVEAGQTKSPESSPSGTDHQPANSLTLQHMEGGLGNPLASQSPWALSRRLIIPIPCINGYTGDKRLNYLDGEPPTTASLCLPVSEASQFRSPGPSDPTPGHLR